MGTLDNWFSQQTVGEQENDGDYRYFDGRDGLPAAGTRPTFFLEIGLRFLTDSDRAAVTFSQMVNGIIDQRDDTWILGGAVPVLSLGEWAKNRAQLVFKLVIRYDITKLGGNS